MFVIRDRFGKKNVKKVRKRGSGLLRGADDIMPLEVYIILAIILLVNLVLMCLARCGYQS